MFYCNDCAQHYERPETMSRSLGRCEDCGRQRPCNDGPGQGDPVGVEPPPWKIEWAQRPYIANLSDGEMYSVVGSLREHDRLLRIYIERRRNDIRGERAPNINWSAHGAVEPDSAWAYMEMLHLATRVATVGDHQLAELLKQHPEPDEVAA